ncbi:MAG: hypothetical protein AMXMBFR12_01980 [Candidatus Babeliales bacterium]
MNSMKKVILLTCLAGTVGSMNAGIWQNVKDSCSGFYAACAKSVNENTTALSTSACKMYASCIDTLHTNKDAAVTGIGAMGTKIATTASNTRETISNGVTSAGQTVVKVTAPVVNPVVSATQSIANGVTNTAIFTYEHPYIVGSGALLATVAYLKICRNNAFNAAIAINKAKDITDCMDDADLVPKSSLLYWHYHGTQKTTWKNSADILANWEEVYNAFKAEKGNGASEDDICFINRMTKELDAAKKPLNSILKELKNALAEYYLAPSTQSHQDRCKNNYVNQVIARHMANHAGYNGPASRFLDLARYEIEAIDREISNKVSRSFINPVKIARRFALPDEAETISQYWKIYQLIQRIEALQECLSYKQAELNGGLQAK